MSKKGINRSIDQFTNFIVAEERTLNNIKGIYQVG